jgi:uncharacterized protein YprB with RNaseH-like and TPR domain
MTLSEYISGSEKTYRGGTFYIVERGLEEMDAGTLADYTREHKDMLLAKNLGARFSELATIPKKKMLFLDIENCGLGIDSPIISIAMAHMHHGADIDFECLFARNPQEEKPLLQYFLSQLQNYEAFFTYNGKSFDAPRIRARAIHNGLYAPELMDLGGLLSKLEGTPEESQNGSNGHGPHHDLYHICRHNCRLDLTDSKLKTIEKTLPEFGHFRRKDDLASADIPKVYYEYVYGRKRMSRKVVADRPLWKKCMEKAEGYRQSYCDSNPNFAPAQIEEMVRGFARKIYEGSFGDLIGTQLEEFSEAEGGYVDQYYPGEKIDEHKRKMDMARLIHHNLLDTVTLTALLCYLCGPHSEQPVVLSSDGELQFCDYPPSSDSDRVPF